jgi:spore coat protein U-like protein
MMNWHIAILMVLGMLATTGLHAQQHTTLRISATVEEYCDVTAPDHVAPSKDGARSGASRRAALHLRATCSPNTTYKVGLNKNTSHSAATLTGVGTGSEEDHTVFGGVPATEVVPPSNYADTIMLRVYY